MEIGMAMGISVVITLPTNPRINMTVISSDATNDMILKSSKVIKKDTKNTELTKKGIIKFAAM